MPATRVITICLSILLVACSKQMPGKAESVRNYSHSIEPFDVLLISKKYLNIDASYEWNVCNMQVAEKEGYGEIQPTLNWYIEGVVKDNIRFIAIEARNKDEFLSPALLKKLKNEISKGITKKGICVQNLKIAAHNKSLKTGTPQSGAP